MPVSLGDIAKKAGHKPKRQQPTFYKGPEEDGVTQSLLGRFLVCRERMRLKLVDGLGPVERFNPRLEYGDLWHVCEEVHLAGGDWQAALLAKAREKVQEHGASESASVEKWYQLCKRQFPRYVKYWKSQPSDGSKPLLQEYEFAIPYRLPSGCIVTLRGKIDGVNLVPKGSAKGLWLQENKTKGNPDERKIKRELAFDLQTMFYLFALMQLRENGTLKTEEPIRGIMYNVIRRPLSGGRGNIQQKEGRFRKPKNKAEREKHGEQVPVPGESNAEYYDRLMTDYVDKEPDYWFMRWDTYVTEEDIARFVNQCLNPVLEQFCNWWTWVDRAHKEGRDPFVSCTYEGMRVDNKHHWRHPFGVYNVLNEGGSTEYDEFMDTGDTSGLRKITRLFPELNGAGHAQQEPQAAQPAKAKGSRTKAAAAS